ncbi:DUF2249 domain-containing protein [Natronobacterium texcoconense]|uniref:Uncharacterized conserved protein, DUF2249 family n=1 Tax=Natronobacterium texcoconense TaxID=1095778 RepID=A0A1H1HJN6_NATTX|nr:DUF2249 domain-containing protein [Natronobacterium texcoconense]SDR25599.1 Uncharacterized conserved protein, DUF2249 family [Natronobacterium texcoconense]
MTTEIDLREQPVDEYRTYLFEVLNDAGAGDTFEIVAEEDVDPYLVRYQLEHDRALEWEYDHPDAEPRKLQLSVGDLLDGEFGTIDVRDLKPQRRHEALLEIFNGLDASEGFVLVNDHDPKPLYHELSSMHGDVVGWEYENKGDGEWRVEIEKTGESEAEDGDVVTSYDVRKIPKQERHPTIHHRYGMIPEGGTMEIIAPHEPRPLRQEFQQKYSDSFEWEIVDQKPGECRVHITKRGETDNAETDDGSTSLEIIEELDVRDLPPAQRHEKIFDSYADLTGGEGFVLVNDHDPKPLYHQFDAEAGPEFRWEYRKKEPGEFRVLIGKTETAAAASEPTESSGPPF